MTGRFFIRFSKVSLRRLTVIRHLEIFSQPCGWVNPSLFSRTSLDVCVTPTVWCPKSFRKTYCPTCLAFACSSLVRLETISVHANVSWWLRDGRKTEQLQPASICSADSDAAANLASTSDCKCILSGILFNFLSKSRSAKTPVSLILLRKYN